MQLTNNLFLHHLGIMRPVQFFKNNADHRRCRSGGAIFVSKNYGFFLQKFWIIYDDRRGKKKARLACNLLLGHWTLQGVTAYKAKHTYIEALWCVCIFSYHNFKKNK